MNILINLKRLSWRALASFTLFSASAMAQVGTFESKVNSLTDLIVGKILPAVAVFGLVYAAILAAAGDETSKRRMVLVVIASIVGLLAKFIFPMFASAV